MGGGGGGGHRITQQINQITYAPYIQQHHTAFLNEVATYKYKLIDKSPFSDFTKFDIENAFFGAGYTIANYSSLFPLFNEYILNIDLDVLYNSVVESTLNNQAIHDLIVAEGALLNDDIETNALPRMTTGSRDINSSLSSTFLIGRSQLEAARLKNLAKFSAELKYRLLPIANERWATILNWNKNVVATYAEYLKFYIGAHTDVSDFNYEMITKDTLWPFTILDHQRAALAALQGAKSSSKDVMGSSTNRGQKAMAGALSGAAMGAQIGMEIGTKSAGIWGAVIGAVVGGAAGYYS